MTYVSANIPRDGSEPALRCRSVAVNDALTGFGQTKNLTGFAPMQRDMGR